LENNIKVDIKKECVEGGCEHDSFGLNSDQWWALVNVVKNL
jgi:hypothetical protein